MLVRRFLSGKEIENVGSVTTAIFLWFDEQGRPRHLLLGEQEQFKELFIFGSINWPSLLPWEQETVSAIRRILVSQPILSELERTRLIAQASVGDGLLKTAFETGSSHVQETGESYLIETSGSREALTGLRDSLVFLRSDGKNFVAANGGGSQKQLLMFYGTGILWGESIREELEDALHGGPFKHLWFNAAWSMGEVKTGEIKEIKSEDPL